MASSGPNSPAAGGSSLLGADDWLVSTGHYASGGSISYAQPADFADLDSYYLLSTNFSFAIPAGTIDGIVVEFTPSQANYGGAVDSSVKLIIGGAVAGSERSTGASFPSYPNTSSYFTRGGVSDLWGLTPSVAQINASNFGVAIACTATGGLGSNFVTIDHVRITVYYTASGGGAAAGTGFMSFFR